MKMTTLYFTTEACMETFLSIFTVCFFSDHGMWEMRKVKVQEKSFILRDGC